MKQLFTQTEIADKLGISKGTLSKWISKNNVSPEKITGNKKLYTETIISDYRNAKRVDKTEKKVSFSTIEFLKKELREKGIAAINRDEVSSFLQEHVKADAGLDYRDFYSMYTIRRDNARARERMKLPGPHKTLEDHFIQYVTALNKEKQSQDTFARE